MKLHPSHLNGHPCTLMHRPLNAPAATARAAGTHFKTGLAKQRPGWSPARVQALHNQPGRRALEQIHTFPT
jgi:hypothetical protein